MTAARIIEALGSLLWPLLLAVVVLRVVPHLPGLMADLREALRTRAFKVKIGGAELSVEEATEQLRRQVTDLQTQMAAQLAERSPATAAAAGAAPLAYQDRPTDLFAALPELLRSADAQPTAHGNHRPRRPARPG